MTLKDVSKQLYNLAVDHRVNGIAFTSLDKLTEYIKYALQDRQETMRSISLPDGQWSMMIYRNGNEYDYFISETRDKERRMLDAMPVL